MLRLNENVDLEARLIEVDTTVEQWKDVVGKSSSSVREEFLTRLYMSLIHHDAALEGAILEYSEIHAAMQTALSTNIVGIPSYERTKNYYQGCLFAKKYAADHRDKMVQVSVIKDLYATLFPEAKSTGFPYRKEKPLHRLYYHEIAQPEKIAYRMRKLGEWMESSEAAALQPIERVAKTHYMLMAVFPWGKNTGRVARIFSNLMLEQAGYPIAVIHSIDRQRYYEALCGETNGLYSMYLEAVETSAKSEIQIYSGTTETT